MHVSEQCTDLKTDFKINTCPYFLNCGFNYPYPTQKHWTKHLTYNRGNTNYPLWTSLLPSSCLNTGVECHFWCPNDPSWPPATVLEWPGALYKSLEHSRGLQRYCAGTTVSQSKHPGLQLTRTRISFLTQLLISHEITENMAISASSFSALPVPL